MQVVEVSEVQKIQGATWHVFSHPRAKLEARRQPDIVIEIAHLPRQRGKPAAQSRRDIALERRQHLDPYAVAQKILMRVAAVVHEARADRIQIAHYFVPPDA